MRGVVFRGERQLELLSFDDPVPGDDEVVLEIKASGFCGSDLHHYRGPRGASLMGKSPAFLAEHGLSLDDPIIAGHEPCGVIAELGRNVDARSFRRGDRVAVYHYAGCCHCEPCRSGWVQMCDRGSTVFGHTAHGAHAPYMRVPARALIHLPPEIGFAAGAAIACGTGTAYAALERLELSARDTLAVFGMGPVGQSAIQLAAAMGVRAFAVDVSDERVATALRFGAAQAINSSQADAVEAIHQWTQGRGATVALDCSGVAAAREAAVRSTSNWGRVAFVGVGGGVSLDAWPDLMLRQRTVIGHWTFSDTGLARCVRFVAEHGVDLERQFTDRWTLADAELAYRRFDTQTSGKACFEF
ncbi:MAG: zinc-binding dehydrogenase [Piscinibacter sp.]|uniref:zinc-binding dehydrogenase n=1 Tax=Piscinibacter TaxID=1114981 RepID=UPI000FDE47A3|nr:MULTISPECIES: zinc-binding dehydrogenase [Piscinibacter]MCW5666247.1 zinc-binding dehydrogenase [Piscinibacter sp.]